MSLVNQGEVNSLLTKLKNQLNVGLPNLINKSGLTNSLTARGGTRVGSNLANASANFITHGIIGIQSIDITTLNVTNIQKSGTTTSGTFVFNANFKSPLKCITQGVTRYKFLVTFANVGLNGKTRISNSTVMATGNFSVTEINNQINIDVFNFTRFNLHFGAIQTIVNISSRGLGQLRYPLIGRIVNYIRGNSIQQLHMEAQDELKAVIQQQINTEIKSI